MLILNHDDVKALLSPDLLVDALSVTMADLSAGRVSMPERVAAFVSQPTATGLLDMPCYVPSQRALTSKLVTIFPGNAGGDVPVRQALIVVFDPETGTPAALMDGTYITAARTAACSALSVRLLARADASTLAVLGTGVQARAHALTVARMRPFREIRIAGRDLHKASALAAELSVELNAEVSAGLDREQEIDVRAVATYEQALDGAEVACAATYAVEPVVCRGWVSPGTHITSVGYNPRGREVDDDTIRDCLLFVESRQAALSAIPPNRDIAEPIERGVISADHVHAELGEVVLDAGRGRTDDEQITLYKSVGVAVQDAAAAALVLAAARERGQGQDITL